MRKRIALTIFTALLLGLSIWGCNLSQVVQRGTPTAEPVVATIAQPTATPIPLSTLAPTAAPTSRAAPTAIRTVLAPQRLSAGDPYAPELGNGGYDVQQYTLWLALDPDVQALDARVSIQAISAVDDLVQVSLDFVGFEIERVLVDGTAASFFRQDGKLIVNLPRPLATGVTFTVRVDYHGAPTRAESRYVPFVPYLGLIYRPDYAFVVAEPDGARYWFPANDHPRDKAHFRFELIVPQGLTGVANGRLLEVQPDVPHPLRDDGPGELYVWEHAYPLAPAFATVVVGAYERLEGTSPGGIPLRHYVFPEDRAAFEPGAARVGEMIDWMSERFGPYPFEAFGYAEIPNVGASLETQTMVVLSQSAIDDELTMAHELAHMWFGDWVSLDSWGDMWRSEGFATYVQFMWLTGDDAEEMETVMARLAESVAERDSGYPLDDPPPARLFGSDSYYKGALLVHALRQEMGDEAFFAGLRAYFEQYGGDTATHAQFQTVMEEAAGISLDAFFAEWFAP